MTAGEFLGQYQQILRKVEILEEQIDKYETIASGGSLSNDGQPRSGGNGDKLAEMAVKAADIQSELYDKYNELMAVKADILQVICQVKSEQQVVVLKRHYLDDAQWYEISLDIDRSVRQTHRIHEKALVSVNNILKNRKCH